MSEALRRLQEDMVRQLARVNNEHSRRTLRHLTDLLDRAGARRLDSAAAESLVALRLIRAGLVVEADVATPGGRTCDFRAERDGSSLCVHVKRLHSNPAPAPAIPRDLRAAIRCGRRVSAEIWWAAHLPSRARTRLGRAFDRFLSEAAIGESLLVRGADGRETGRAHIRAPAPRLTLRTERRDRLPTLERIERLVLRAFDQCMPRAANVIVMVGDRDDDGELLDAVLRGSFVERWDQFPSRGERRAYGRADDGLWSRRGAPWCGLAVFLALRKTGGVLRLSPGTLLVRDAQREQDAAAGLVRRGLLRSR